MDLTLPNKINVRGTTVLKNAKIIVVIGANGSGKTRFGTKLENTYPNQSHRISAQKSLSMPDRVSPTSREFAENDFFFGLPGGKLPHKSQFRWGNKPNTFLLNDFEKLLVLLHTEEYEESIKFREAYKHGQVAKAQ
jgi:energy-coupling factor transporter ATP-binding protein EcfA2